MKKLLVVMAVATATLATYKLTRDDAPPTKTASLAQDRIWIDHLPRNERDTIQLFIALGSDPYGVFQATSQWAGKYEAFRYEMMGEELRLVFPQTGDREKTTAKAKECDSGGFQYCLELSGNSRGVKKYYSMEGWELDHLSRAAALAKVEAITNALPRTVD